MRDKMIAAGLWQADDPRDPSVSIEAAWEVMDQYVVKIHASILKDDYLAHYVAGTAPLAICLAALKAVGCELPQETR